MPWKEMSVMESRLQFVLRLEAGERMSDLCHEFQISRKTGYKFLDRYKTNGLYALEDASRRPMIFANRTSVKVVDLIVQTKKEHPTWGASKIKAILERAHTEMHFPVRATFHNILDRHNLVKRRGRTKKYMAVPTHLSESHEANDIWCIDFKGQFRLKNSKYCYPLTASDHYSRFLIACEAFERINTDDVFQAFIVSFKEYGLPNIIRSDNGVPFSTRSPQGLSRLSAWFLRLGIGLERIQPGHPEQNGRHERMHKTLKLEAIQTSTHNVLQQQEIFDLWRETYNNKRPHEALGMATPSEYYKRSTKTYPDQLPFPRYDGYDFTKIVDLSGRVSLKGQRIVISTSLSGHPVGIVEEDEKLWKVNFMGIDVGYIDEVEQSFTPVIPDHLEKCYPCP